MTPAGGELAELRKFAASMLAIGPGGELDSGSSRPSRSQAVSIRSRGSSGEAKLSPSRPLTCDTQMMPIALRRELPCLGSFEDAVSSPYPVRFPICRSDIT